MVETALALIVFLVPLAWSPGPGNMFFAANGARFGLRATLPANIGYHVATWIVTVAVGLGFAAALAEAPALFQAVRIAGSVYVLWLAYKLWTAGSQRGGSAARAAGFVDGAVLLVLNPKAYVILALMFSQFLPGTEGQRMAAVLMIATVFTLNNMIAFMAWTLAGDRIGRVFASETGARGVNRVFGMILAAVAVWMAVG